jgi:hypothetical protein
MTAPMHVVRKVWDDLRSNPRLRWGLVLIAIVVLVEGGLRWSDAIAQRQQVLVKLQADVIALRTGLKNDAALTESLEASRKTAALVDARLWTVSSEAVGQAKMKDWLTEVVKRNIADQYAINLNGSRELGKRDATGGAAPVATPAQTEAATAGVREFRANVSFRLTPRALEGVLLDVEGGEPFAVVESLLVKGQERRVEATVRVLMRIQPQEASHG